MKKILLILTVLLIIITSFDCNAQIRKKLAGATSIENAATAHAAGDSVLSWTYPVWQGSDQHFTFALDIETTSANTEFAGTLKVYGSWDNSIWISTAVASAAYTMLAAVNETWETAVVDGFRYPYAKMEVVTENSAQTINVTPWIFGVKK